MTAVNDRGDAAVAWIENHVGGPEAAFAIDGAFSRGGRPFGRAVRVSHGNGAGPAVAVDAAGRMTLAWSDWRHGRVGARTRSAGGVLRPAQWLTADHAEGSHVGALPGGSVVWEERDPGLSRIELAAARADGTFAKSRLLLRRRGQYGDVVVLLGGDAVLEVEHDRRGRPVRVRRLG